MDCALYDVAVDILKGRESPVCLCVRLSIKDEFG